MPLQSLFTSALLNDIESSHLLQQTITALQANKFVQVKMYMYNTHFLNNCIAYLQKTAFFFFLIYLIASTWEEK